MSRSTNLEFGAAEHFLVVRTVDGRILHASEACGGVPPLPEQLTPNCQLWCQLWFRVVGLDCSVWRSAKHRAAAAAPAPPHPRTKWTRRVPPPVLIGHAASSPPAALLTQPPGPRATGPDGEWAPFSLSLERLSASETEVMSLLTSTRL